MSLIESTGIVRYEGHPVGIVRFSETMESMSCAVLNGGVSKASAFFIMQVPKDYCHDDPARHAAEVRDGLGLPTDSVGMMTAAEVDHVFSVRTAGFGSASMDAVATAGLSNHVVAGDVLEDWQERHEVSMRRAARMMAGTINIAVVSGTPLTDVGKVNLMIPLVEAKSAALADHGFRETGTTSDSMAVFSPAGDARALYTGTGSDIGIAASRAVRAAVGAALGTRGEHPLADNPVRVLDGLGLLEKVSSGDGDTSDFEDYISDPRRAGLFDMVRFIADRADSMSADGDDRYRVMVGSIASGILGRDLPGEGGIMNALVDAMASDIRGD